MPGQQSSTVPKPIRALDAFIFRVARFSDQVSAFICAFLIVVMTAAMVVYQLGITIPWLDDVLRLLIIWLVYMGCVSLCLDNDHICMDGLYLTMTKPLRRMVDVFSALLGVFLCGYVAYWSYRSMAQEIGYGMLLPSGYLPGWLQSLALPVCFGLMTLAYLSFLFSLFTGRRHRRISEEDRLKEARL
jgi:TRAP-type C4-dicarboxylate transport system permease small subunit